MLVLLWMTAAVSCSVKEDRRGCPAWCVVASDGYVADNYQGRLLCSIATDIRSNYGRSREEFADFKNKGDLVFEVPRDENVYVDVFSGVGGMLFGDKVLAISPGECCDSVYAGHSSVFVTGDEVQTELPLNKEFATMLLMINGLESSFFSFRIIGNVDGYCIPGGRPHIGRFEYCAPAVEGASCQVRLPRQVDDSLLLEILGDDGHAVSSIPLGRAIAEQGYDWNAADLRDFAIGVDMRELKFTITIEAWDGSRTITIIL